MVSILQAKDADVQLLADIGRISFIESHGSSAPEADINAYVKEKYTCGMFKEELRDPKNSYYLIYYNNQPAGYSKIIFDISHPNVPLENTVKLERFYLLKEFYGLELGLNLLNFNINISKKNNQSGMWLFVWENNHRAVNFYKRNGFKIVGSHSFKITETHSNPNHQMLLLF